jgi:hypothetical protein
MLADSIDLISTAKIATAFSEAGARQAGADRSQIPHDYAYRPAGGVA